MKYNSNERDALDTAQPSRSASRWPLWAGIIVVILVAGLAMSEIGGSTGTDPSTTASTTRNSPTAIAPAAENAAPATPAQSPATPAK